MYVADLFNISWEILRWRRFKSNAINIRLRHALKHVIEQLLGESNDSFNELADNAEDLSILYYCNVTVKSEVAKILARFGLDESAILAQALRDAFSELEAVDKTLDFLETRRDRALACFAAYRKTFTPRMLEYAGHAGANSNNSRSPKSAVA
jgi:hypothetical protein